MNIIEAEIIEYLIVNDYELVYDTFGIFIGIKGGNGSLLSAEIIDELKYISQQTWLESKHAISNL
jgi:hypothetical protein